MPSLPTGTVTLVFTDIQGSSELWERYRDAFQPVLDAHNRLMRDAAARWEGYEVKTEGDAFFLSFARASDAVQFAVEVQRCFQKFAWTSLHPNITELRVRMGLHTGEPLIAHHPDGTPDYVGPVVNRAARVGSVGHGGQIVLSQATYSLVRDAALPDLGYLDLEQHRLKGVGEEHLWQVLHPELPMQFPALKTLDARPHNLPLQLTPFLGRERELEETRRLLRKARLLTLTGPGGTGKTRLSLQLAEEVSDDFPDGVFFVALSEVHDGAQVTSTIAATLGVSEAGGVPLEDTIREYLRPRELLLVLDNFEQVVQAAPLVNRLLSGAPHLRVLITSRSVLRIQGEQEYPVPPLSLPERNSPLPPERLSQYTSVALFIQRALAVRPDFQVTNENAPAVAEICVRLDGLPLAIELAAARVKLLAPQALLARLDQRLKLLTGGGRDLPARQQTLRNAIAWSHDLLDEEEKRLFRRLSVFAGCRLEAVEAVCEIDPDDLMAFDGVAALTEKSLLRQEEDADGEPRFLMLETIREFAADGLQAAGEADTLRERHATYYLELLVRSSNEIDNTDGQDHDLIDREYRNLQRALTHFLERQDADGGLRLCVQLFWYWAGRGRLTEGREWFQRFFSLPHEHVDPSVRARALYGAGCLCEDQSEYEEAHRFYEQSQEIYRAINDRVGMAHLLVAFGSLASSRCDYARARDCYTQALGFWREIGHQRHIAVALSNLGTLAFYEGDLEESKRYSNESLQIRRTLGLKRGIAVSVTHLGLLASREGDLETARSHYEESLAAMRELQDPGAVAVLLNNLADILSRQGKDEEAMPLALESLETQHRLGDRFSAAYTLETLCALAQRTGNPARCVLLFAAADALRQAIGAPLPEHQSQAEWENVNAARAELGDEAFEQYWAKGAVLTFDQAAARALQAE